MSFACVASIAAVVSEIAEVATVLQAVMQVVQKVEQMVSQADQSSMQSNMATNAQATQLQDPQYRQQAALTSNPDDPNSLRAKYAGAFASATANALVANFGVNASPDQMLQQLKSDPKLSAAVGSMASTLGMTPDQLIGVVGSEIGLQRSGAGGSIAQTPTSAGLPTAFPSQYEGQVSNYSTRIPSLVGAQVPSIPTFAGRLSPELEANGVSPGAFSRSVQDGTFHAALSPAQGQNIDRAAAGVGMSPDEFLRDVAKEVDRIQSAGLGPISRPIA